MRVVPPQAISLIKSFEGFRLDVYLDSVNKPTVGVGHLILPEDNLHLGDHISEEQSDAFLEKDLQIAAEAIEAAVKVPLSDNQFSALLSFVFNLGEGNLRKSTLLSKLNAGDYGTAADEFLKWNKAGGLVVKGLTRRRVAERALFLQAGV